MLVPMQTIMGITDLLLGFEKLHPLGVVLVEPFICRPQNWIRKKDQPYASANSFVYHVIVDEERHQEEGDEYRVKPQKRV